MGLQGVVYWSEPAHECLEPVEITRLWATFVPPIRIGARMQLADPGVQEGDLIEQLRP